MKKLILLICVLCWSYNTNAQCDATLPVFENFDTNTIGVCWQVNDSDGDSNNWFWKQYSTYYGGYKVIASNSFYTSTGALNPDNWIISNAIDLRSYSSGSTITLSWKVRGELAGFSHEYYSIYAATNSQISSFTSSTVKRSEYVDEVGGAGVFVTRTLNLSALAGNMVYIAFRHHNSSNEYNINIDDVSISTGGSSGGCISDSDKDGICDPNDQCPLLNNSLIGTPCNDGNPCTINDVYTSSNCGCTGTYADTDNDGVCDYYDACPGFDDRIDTNGNGIPDGCESSTCNSKTANFANNPLTHSGSGTKSTTLSLPTNSQDASFTISGLGKKTKGKSGSLYIENVVVTYVDGASVSKTYGTYNGSNVSSATINITGKVKSITVSLSNFSGTTSSTLSVNLSTVTYCISSSGSEANNTSSKELSSQQDINESLDSAFKIFPNPASSKLYVKSTELNESKTYISLYNMNGIRVRSYDLNSKISQTNNELDINGLPTGLYILRIIGEHGDLLKTERIIIK